MEEESKEQIQAYLKVGRETRGHWVGPMDPALFLDTFLPQAQPSGLVLGTPSLSSDVLSMDLDENDERDSLIKHLAPYARALKFLKSESPPRTDSSSPPHDDFPMDIGAYTIVSSESDAATMTISSDSLEIPIFCVDADPFCDSDSTDLINSNSSDGESRMEVFEKNKSPQVPFERPDFDTYVGPDRHLSTRGRIGVCLASLSALQFRLHAFAVLTGTCKGASSTHKCQWARILRWDRSGFIVTKRFSYSESESESQAQENHLVEFFRRYSSHIDISPSGPQAVMISAVIRGHDPTVRTWSQYHSGVWVSRSQTPEECSALIRLAQANPYGHREFRVLMIDGAGNDKESESELPFIISYPQKPRHRHRLRHSSSPLGRGTRRMLAFDVLKNKIVFIKDDWRSTDGLDDDDRADSDSERDIYQILHAANVPNIPTFGRGGRVSGQEHVTLTEVIAGRTEEAWGRSASAAVAADGGPGSGMPASPSLRHHRISLEGIGMGRPLCQFESSHELVSAIADAAEAHSAAFHDAKILYQDGISADSVVITEDGRGMLVDWEASLNLSSPSLSLDLRLTTGKEPTPTRTSPFQAARLLPPNSTDPTNLNSDSDPTPTPHDIQVELQERYIDGKESFLYLILYNMTFYTPFTYTRYQGASERQQERYKIDELRSLFSCGEADDPRGSGVSKQLFVLEHYRDYQFTDRRPRLTALIHELCRTFRVRYSLDDPSLSLSLSVNEEDEENGYAPPRDQRRFWKSEAGMMAFPRKGYACMRRLVDREWFVDVMREYLEPREMWPVADGACEERARRILEMRMD